MRWGRALAPVALPLALVTPALAAGHSLEAVKLQEKEIPGDFHGGTVKVYAHFAARMTAPITAGGMASTATCSLPAAAARWGWTRGLVQGFDAPKLGDVLQVCASQFSSAHGAHLFYRQQVAANIKPYLKLKMDKPMPASAGNEATGMMALTPGCSCSPALTHAAYEIVFRQGIAVVAVNYSGASTFTATEFRALVGRSDARLR